MINSDGGPYASGPGTGQGGTTLSELQEEKGQFDTVMTWFEENPFIALGLAVAFWYVFVGRPKVGTYVPRD